MSRSEIDEVHSPLRAARKFWLLFTVEGLLRTWCFPSVLFLFSSMTPDPQE